MLHELGFLRVTGGLEDWPHLPMQLVVTAAAGHWMGVPAAVAAQLGIVESAALQVSVCNLSMGRPPPWMLPPATWNCGGTAAVQALLSVGVAVATWD